jgi:hypothetical protein
MNTIDLSEEVNGKKVTGMHLDNLKTLVIEFDDGSAISVRAKEPLTIDRCDPLDPPRYYSCYYLVEGES